MDKMTLSEIAAAVGAAAPAVDACVDSVCIDSRAVTPGCLFVAIKGENFDGHAFVKNALSAGAAAALCSVDIPDAPGPVLLVEDTVRAMGALAAHNRAKYDIPLVGLTGSVGKTTSKDMVAAVLSQHYKTLATEGNLNNEIGLPRMCLRLDGSYEAAVIEMGMSDFGEISRLTAIARPTIGLITNIGVSHIERLGSREGILSAKLEILEGMAPDAPIVLNGDDDMLMTVADRLERPVVLYGIHNPNAHCIASDIRQLENELRFTLTYKDVKRDIILPTVGMHNVYNACAAFVCGMLAGVTPDEAAAGLAGYVSDGRRQKFTRKNGVTFIEDCYNASPDSIRASLAVLASAECKGKRIAVLGDMLELGDYAQKAHTDCGVMVAENGIDLLLAYGTNAKYYVEGAGERVESMLFSDKAQLADHLYGLLAPGDTVLFKASRGMKLEDVFNAIYQKLSPAE